MSWTRENIEKFIDLYRCLPSLWKIKSDDYKNRKLKNKAYANLVEFCKSNVDLNANKELVIKKIQGLRGSFRKELKKINASNRSGSADEELYKPSLWYFELLLFTKDQEEPTESLSNVEEGSCNSEEIQETIPSQDRPTNEIEEMAESQTDKETTNESVLDNNKYFNSPQKGTKRKLSSSSSNERNQLLRNICQGVLEQSNADTSEYEAVGINVWKKLERMEPTQAIYAEGLLNQILNKGLLKQLTSITSLSENLAYKLNSNKSINHTPIRLDDRKNSSNSTQIYEEITSDL